MRAGRLSESPGRAARRSVRVRGETGGANDAEEANGTATPCTAVTAGAAPGRGVVDRAAITTTTTANAPKTALDPRENRPAREDAP